MKLHPFMHSRTIFWTFLSITWLASLWYTGSRLNRGWVPYDDGSISEGALRVRAGQLPHHDYIELYTGGLAYLNAATFSILGTEFINLRLVMFAVFALWVPAFYYVATRVASPWTASAATFLAVVWSVPNYTCPMPSWYNLFLATFGIAALCRFIQTNLAWWTLAAGLMGGLSVLVKISGLYYVAGVLLFFLFFEQGLNQPRNITQSVRSYCFRGFVLLAIVLFVLAFSRLIHVSSDPTDYFQFVVPALALAICVGYRELQVSGRSSLERFRRLFKISVPFLVGVLIPIGFYCIPFAHKHALSDLYRGIFVLPFKRIGNAARPPIDFAVAIFEVPVFCLFALGFHNDSRVRRWITAFWVSAYALICIFAFSSVLVYKLGWFPMTVLVPFASIGSAILLTHWGLPSSSTEQAEQQTLFLVASVAATCNVIQYPFFEAVYFCYIAALAILLVVALCASIASPPRSLLAATIVFSSFFAIWVFSPGFIYHMGWFYGPETETSRMTIDVARGIRAAPLLARDYSNTVQLISSKLNGGRLIASPDCPEIYVMLNEINPTPAAFDFFEDVGDYKQLMVRLLDAPQTTVVVVNTMPEQSKQFLAPLKEAINGRFENKTTIGKFEIYWRP